MNSSPSILISDNGNSALAALVSKRQDSNYAFVEPGIINIETLATMASSARMMVFSTDSQGYFQNHRQAKIAVMMGVRSFVLLVENEGNFQEETATEIENNFSNFIQSLGEEGEISLAASCFFANQCDGTWQNHKALWELLALSEGTASHSSSTEKERLETADQFETSIVWVSKYPMMAGRPYHLKIQSTTVDASITTLKYSVNLDTGEKLAAKILKNGTIGICNISLGQSMPFERQKEGRVASNFSLHDKESDELIGIGVIHFALRRASNVHWQALDVTREMRANLMRQKPAILWFTGLSGSGKSAIANIVEKKLTRARCHTYTLDGDNVRHGLNRDLGFTDVDRVENIRRIAEVSKLMADSGLITLVSFISPFRSERQLARELVEDGEFIEIHVDTPLEVAEARDVKGLYKKARAGKIANFTGIDSPYEPPENPEIRVDTVAISAEGAADLILEKLKDLQILERDFEEK